MNERDKPALEKEARRLFLRASRELPADLEARLDQARRRALDGAGSGRHPRALQRRLLWPAGALAASAAMLLLWQPAPRTAVAPPSQTAAQPDHGMDTEGDLPPDAVQSDAGMYRDLAFYQWLATDAPASRRP